MNRRHALLGVAGAVLTGATGVATWSATRARTPQQRAAQAAPPSPSTVTVPVRRGRLADRTVLAGQLSRATSVEVTAPQADGVVRSIVTKLPKDAGAEVAAGDVVAEVSGRPVIVLAGEFPSYRDMTRGAEGPDVRQLQRALFGRADRESSGTFDVATEAELLRLLKKHGYSAVTRGGRVVLPAGEVAYVPTLPATVLSTGARIGQEAKGALLTLGSGDLTVVAPVPPEAEPALSGKAELTFGAGPLEGRGTELLDRRERPAADGQPAVREAVFRVDGRADADPAAGQEVLVVRHGSRSNALIVPLSALWTAADGTVTVVVARGGERRSVPVKVEVSALGEAVVVGDLAEGDPVVVTSR